MSYQLKAGSHEPFYGFATTVPAELHTPDIPISSAARSFYEDTACPDFEAMEYAVRKLGRGRVSVGSCRGDIGPLCVEQTGDCPALPYGTSLTLPSKVRCTSRRAGLTCRARNGAGAGFAVSRSGYRIFR